MKGDKTVNGMAAAFLLDAVEHFTNLQVAMAELQHQFCIGTSDRDFLTVSEAKKHCRKLLESLKSVDHVLVSDIEKREPAK